MKFDNFIEEYNKNGFVIVDNFLPEEGANIGEIK